MIARCWQKWQAARWSKIGHQRKTQAVPAGATQTRVLSLGLSWKQSQSSTRGQPYNPRIQRAEQRRLILSTFKNDHLRAIFKDSPSFYGSQRISFCHPRAGDSTRRFLKTEHEQEIVFEWPTLVLIEDVAPEAVRESPRPGEGWRQGHLGKHHRRLPTAKLQTIRSHKRLRNSKHCQ